MDSTQRSAWRNTSLSVYVFGREKKNGHLEVGKFSGCCREIAGKEKKRVNMSFKHYKVVQLCFILSNSIGQET